MNASSAADLAVNFGNISAHVAERKCENFATDGADMAVFGDLGCMLNIEGRLCRKRQRRRRCCMWRKR